MLIEDFVHWYTCEYSNLHASMKDCHCKNGEPQESSSAALRWEYGLVTSRSFIYVFGILNGQIDQKNRSMPWDRDSHRKLEKILVGDSTGFWIACTVSVDILTSQ